LDVYDIGHLGYNTWVFKKTSYKNNHVNQFDPNDQENPIFSPKKKAYNVLKIILLLEGLPLDKKVCNTSFKISRINDV
jgi:hypothetical protein